MTTLLNITHHPSTGWSEEQRTAANALAEKLTVVDRSFPSVDPAATTDQVDLLADDIADDIATRYAVATTIVHLMGEMTLTVALVARLQGLGFRVIASTTERILVDEGVQSRTLRFEFHSFRDYAPLYTSAP